MTSIDCAHLARLCCIEPPVALLRDERPSDAAAREALLNAALGPGRLLKTCERLREGRRPAERLALAACAGEALVGTLRFWRVSAGGAPALLLGPLAVDAAWRSQGLGGRLIAEGLFRAAQAGHAAVLLVGDAPYYERFGFGRSCVRDLRMPGPVEAARFLGLELTPGALAGAKGLVVATGATCGAEPAWEAAQHGRVAALERRAA